MPATSQNRSDTPVRQRWVAWGRLVNESGDRGGPQAAEFAGNRASDNPNIRLGHQKPGSVHLHNPVLPRAPKGWQATY
jgi:hypothetical protein